MAFFTGSKAIKKMEKFVPDPASVQLSKISFYVVHLPYSTFMGVRKISGILHRYALDINPHTYVNMYRCSHYRRVPIQTGVS